MTAVDPGGPPQGDVLRLTGLIRGASRFGEVEVCHLPGLSVPGDRPVRLAAKWAWDEWRRTRSLYMAVSRLRMGDACSGGAYQGVVAFQLRTAPVARAISADWHILDLTDSLGLYRSRLGGPATLAKRLHLQGVARAEAYWSRQFDESWVSADPDYRWLAERRVTNAAVVGNGVQEIVELPPGDPFRLLFVGNMRYLPNRQGLTWFLRTVWPVLADLHYRLDVVGAGSEAIRGKNVQGHGRVPDVAPFYRRCGVAISPVGMGAGTQNKILEALAHGRPVVAAAPALEGLTAAQGAAVLPARRLVEWQAQLARLHNMSTYREMAAQGVRSVALWGEEVARQLGPRCAIRRNADGGSEFLPGSPVKES